MQCYGYSWEAGQSKQVVYQTADHHIHELYVTVGGTWQHADLTAITGAPPAHQIIEGYSLEHGAVEVVEAGRFSNSNWPHSRVIHDQGRDVAACRPDRHHRGSSRPVYS